eukprot:COSAG05_NODE_15551_length_366_cov_5.947566_1_plen_54_part_10
MATGVHYRARRRRLGSRAVEIAFWGCPSFWRCVHRLDLAFELRGGSGWHQDGDG